MTLADEVSFLCYFGNYLSKLVKGICKFLFYFSMADIYI